MRLLNRFAFLFALVTGLVVLAVPTARATTYNAFATIARTPDASGTTHTQGFAAGSTFLYSIKVNADETRSVIHRVNRSTGAAKIMTNGISNNPYVAGLGHANDIALADINGQHYMFVVTMKTGATSPQLVKLRYDGTTFWKEGTFQLRDGAGAVFNPSGISVLSVSGTDITFFFKKGRAIFQGSIGLSANSGAVGVVRRFTLKVPDSLSTYLNQGFSYDAGKATLYYPLTKANVSYVLVYRNVTGASTGTLTKASSPMVRIATAAGTKFEIEGVGVSAGILYFNTERGAADGVHRVKGFPA